MSLRDGNWGFGSPACLVGAAGAAVAAIARLAQELSGMEVRFMPLLVDDLPGWLVADVSVLVAAIVGGAIGQLACVLAIWIRYER
jgi:hypothetical protein